MLVLGTNTLSSARARYPPSNLSSLQNINNFKLRNVKNDKLTISSYPIWKAIPTWRDQTDLETEVENTKMLMGIPVFFSLK